MGIIKDIYDVFKDGAILERHIESFREALMTEAELNRSYLIDIEKNIEIDKDRMKTIIRNLKNKQLEEAVGFAIPYDLVCDKKVDSKILGKIQLKRIEGYDLKKMVKKLYLKIEFIKGERKNQKIDVLSRLQFICKYNIILLRLLSE